MEHRSADGPRWRTEHHVSASRAACAKTCCPGDDWTAAGDNREEKRARSSAALLICPSLSPSASCWPLIADDDPSATSGCVDCTLYHVHRWLVEEADAAGNKWTRSVVIGRCVGLAPDTLLADDLYHSVRCELACIAANSSSPAEPDDDDDGQRHWIERLGRCLPPGTRLDLVLANIDRLDSWSAVPASKLPDNIRLTASLSTSGGGTSTVSAAGWTLMGVCPSGRAPSAWNTSLLPGDSGASIESALDAYFDRVESEFPLASVRLAAAALTLTSAGRLCCGATERQLRFCFDGGDDVGHRFDQLGALLQSLDPFLIRTDGVGGEQLFSWSRPALVYARKRYADAAAERRHVARRLTLESPENEANPATVNRLYWIGRLVSLVGDPSVPLERERVEETLFDWRTWQAAAAATAGAGQAEGDATSDLSAAVGLHLLWAAIRQSAARWIDSQLWLVERNVPWINQAEPGDPAGKKSATSTVSACAGLVDHLAAQLAVALKPFAEKESLNQQLWRLYQGASGHCDQFRGTLMSAPSGAWNFNHSSVPLERKVLAGERDAIRLMTASPDGQTLVVVTEAAPATTTNDASVDLMYSVSAVTGRRLAVYRGHSGRVTCVHVTGDNQYVASGSEDLSVIVWDLMSGRLLLRTREHIAAVSCLSSSAAGKMIVSGGEDSIVMAFHWPGEGERLARIDHHRGPVTSLAINNRQDVLVSASHDGSVCVWSLDDWSLLNVISVGQPVGHVTLSSDDVFLLAVGLDDGLPRLYSLTTGSPLRTWTDLPIKVAGAVIAAGNGHSYAALLAQDGRLMCYDCHGGQLVHALWIEPPGKNPVRSCCARANDPRLVYHSVGHRIKVWLLRYDERRPAPVTSSITWLAISPLDGAVVAAGDVSGSVHLWRTSNLSKIASWSHPGAVSVVSFDAAGLYIASAADDGTAAVWHLDAGQTLQATQVHAAGCRVSQLVIMADWNGYVLSCDTAETVVQWKLGTGEVVRQWHQAASRAIGVALNTRWMAGLVGSNSARIWSLENGDDGNKETVSVSHTEEVLCLAVTPDSKFLITGSKDSSLKMWEAVPSSAGEKPGKLVQIMAGHSDHVTTVAAANMLSSSSGGPLERQSSNAGSGGGGGGGCNKRLVVVSGSRDGQLIVWDAQHGSETHSMKQHKAAVTCLRMSTDGSVLVSGSEDGTVRAWNLRHGNCLSCFVLTHPVQQIVMSPDASKLWVRMAQKPLPAILELKHSPAVLVKPEVCSRPASPVHLKKPPPTRRLLKKEISLDSYTWLKRYGAKSSALASHGQHPASSSASSSGSAHHAAPPQSTPSVDSLLKLSRRNSFCNVPESGET